MKKFLALLLALVLVLSLVACGNNETPVDDPTVGGEEGSSVVSELYAQVDEALSAQLGNIAAPTGNEKIGAVIISLTNPFWANMKACYEAAAQKLGVTIDVQTGTTEGDTQSQLDTLMTMADMGYDLIIVSPIDGTNLIPGIVKCNENGVKVINLGPGVNVEALTEAGGHLDGKITVNFAEQGETVAKDMIARLPEGGKVAILQGLAGAGQSEGRTAGATEVFTATEGIELVASVPCDWDATKAYDTTKDIITENPDLKGIFACNDVMALAAAEALAAEGVTFPCEIDVLLTHDAGIHQINLDMRQVDRATDVLSFPEFDLTPGQLPGEEDADPGTGLVPLGDMVISMEHVAAQAREYGHSNRRELAYLVVHSVLHLLGYDHLDEGPMKAQMRGREEAIMAELGLTR